MRKGIIYAWKVNGNVMYIGRTVQTLEVRTKGHITEYHNQINSNGLYTKKFIEVNKLPNKWDDIKFEVIEDNIIISILGDREKYWFNYYNDDNKLWNSVKPGSSFIFSLSEEEKFKVLKNRDFKKYIETKVSQLRHSIIQLCSHTC